MDGDGRKKTAPIALLLVAAAAAAASGAARQAKPLVNISAYSWSEDPPQIVSDYVMFMAPFYGPGPVVLRSTRPILLGNTAALYDTDLDPRVTATGATFSRSPIETRGGATELKVQIATTRATPVGTQVTVEITMETNPSEVKLNVTTYKTTAKVEAGQNGQVIIAPFPMSTAPDNQNGGTVTFRATITSVTAPGNVTVQNGTGSAPSSTVSSALTVIN